MSTSDASHPPMPTQPSMLDELRTQYETARQQVHSQSQVEGFHEIDARLRKAFRWLEKAITYLDELKPPIDHRFDLGHGLVFDSPRFRHGSVGQHEHRIVGFPVLDEINLYYDISAARPLALEVPPGAVALAEKALDDAGLQYTSRRVEDSSGVVRKCAFWYHRRYPRQCHFMPNIKPAWLRWRCSTSTGSIESSWNFIAMRSTSPYSRILCV